MRRIAAITLLILFSSIAFATQEKKQARIRISGPGGYLDETSIYFDLGVTPAYGMSEDGPKAFGQMEYCPSIYTHTSDDMLVSTNGYSRLIASEVIPVGIRTDTAGVHTFSASIITNFDATTIIQLEDRQEGIFTDLRTAYYSVQLADEQIIEGRFFLHFSKAVEFAQVTAGCTNNDGELLAVQDNTVTWSSIQLFDSTGQVIDSLNSVAGPYSFTGLAEGTYDLMLTFGQYVTTKQMTVPGTYVVARIQPSAINGNVNQEFVFATLSHNATMFNWELGDSTQIGGVANPTYAYYEPGTYKVILTATNEAGCQYRDSVMVNVSSITGISSLNKPGRKIWAYNNTVTVQLNEEIAQGAELKIYNILGQPVYYSQLTDLTTEIQLNDQPTGYYIVWLQNNKVPFTKKVFVGQSN